MPTQIIFKTVLSAMCLLIWPANRSAAFPDSSPSATPEGDKAETAGLPDSGRKLTGIETARVELLPGRSVLKATGRVLAAQPRMAIVSYAFPARISEVHVRMGDWVEQGQKVLTLQSEEVGNAKSEYYKSQADFDLAKRNYERQKRLHDRGVVNFDAHGFTPVQQ